MFHSVSEERRLHRRYMVRGQAVLRTLPGSSSEKVDEVDEIVNVGGGGLVVLSETPPRAGTELEIHFTIRGYQSEIRAKGRVIRTEIGLAAISFLEPPAGIQELVNWLEAALIAGLLSL